MKQRNVTLARAASVPAGISRTTQKSFRILSLDGGGAWAIIEALALENLYGSQARGWDILSRYDLVAANSAGSLVLGGLVKNLSVGEIIRLFEDQSTRESLFHPLGLDHLLDNVLQMAIQLGPKYSTDRKLEGIRSILGDIGDVPMDLLSREVGCHLPHLMICAFDYDRQRATFFRSDSASLANSQQAVAPTLAEAIHASTNAPVNYFDRPATFPGNVDYAQYRYWDGAVGGYNNPVMAAIVEAMANSAVYGCTAASISALSIGTGAVNLPFPDGYPAASPVLEQERIRPCLTHDLRELAGAILSDPPDAASFSGHVMLGGAVSQSALAPVTDGRLVRINPLIQPVLSGEGANRKWEMPDGLSPEEFSCLLQLDLDAVKQPEVDLIAKLAKAWLNDEVMNQSIRYDADFQPTIGHGLFSHAKTAWLALENGTGAIARKSGT